MVRFPFIDPRRGDCQRAPPASTKVAGNYLCHPKVCEVYLVQDNGIAV